MVLHVPGRHERNERMRKPSGPRKRARAPAMRGVKLAARCDADEWREECFIATLQQEPSESECSACGGICSPPGELAPTMEMVPAPFTLADFWPSQHLVTGNPASELKGWVVL
mmetsp:Transcript_36195/g.88658  ORF Transcript_36195/g.88658 Transcript_36195/m.88658 type:complete len:113 (+) Transcript_36195:59-397(+)